MACITIRTSALIELGSLDRFLARESGVQGLKSVPYREKLKESAPFWFPGACPPEEREREREDHLLVLSRKSTGALGMFNKPQGNHQLDGSSGGHSISHSLSTRKRSRDREQDGDRLLASA